MAERLKRAAALGLFDGVHIGHREIAAQSAAQAGNGLIPSVFTFISGTIGEKRGEPLEYIYTEAYKRKQLKALGIEEIYSESFDNLRDMSGEEFVSEILVRRMNAGYIICGRDFRFGKGASCGFNELSELGRKYGFTAAAAEDVKSNGRTVSSKEIRELLKSGNPVRAAELLGDEYTVSGEIVHGKEIGRALDFPTVNQIYEPGQLVPKHGVYASQIELSGRLYDSVTNIGVKPTIDGERMPLAETHILDFSGNLYGSYAEVKIKRFMRSEMKFDSLRALKAAIEADIEHCREYLQNKTKG